MTYIIAEAGVNHNGSFTTACELIHQAKVCGADAVKFQMFDAERLDPPGPRRDMLRPLELSKKNFADLKRYAEAEHIDFIVTPFDIDSLNFLSKLGVEKIKIGSGDLRNFALLEAAAKTGCDLIVSTGMGDMKDIWNALRATGWERVTLLHCTSAYPTPPEDVNLKAMQTMWEAFHCPVGLSDHTQGIAAPLAAAALGAEMIEKHFTLDCHAEGPDHVASLEPKGFRVMVDFIREIEQMLGSGIKASRLCESEVMEIVVQREAWRRDPVEAYKDAAQGI